MTNRKQVLLIGTIHTPVDLAIEVEADTICNSFASHLMNSTVFFESSVVTKENMDIMDAAIYRSMAEKTSNFRFIDEESESQVEELINVLHGTLDGLAAYIAPHVKGSEVYRHIIHRIMSHPEMVEIKNTQEAEVYINEIDRRLHLQETWQMELDYYSHLEFSEILRYLDEAKDSIAAANDALMSRDDKWRDHLDFSSENVTIVVGKNHITKLVNWYEEAGYHILSESDVES